MGTHFGTHDIFYQDSNLSIMTHKILFAKQEYIKNNTRSFSGYIIPKNTVAVKLLTVCLLHLKNYGMQ